MGKDTFLRWRLTHFQHSQVIFNIFKASSSINLKSIITANVILRHLSNKICPTLVCSPFVISKVCYQCKDSGIHWKLFFVFSWLNFGALLWIYAEEAPTKENVITHFVDQKYRWKFTKLLHKKNIYFFFFLHELIL